MAFTPVKLFSEAVLDFYSLATHAINSMSLSPDNPKELLKRARQVITI